MKLTKKQNNFKITLKSLEDDLLTKLSAAEGNFLGNSDLVESLEKTKKTAEQIEVRWRSDEDQINLGSFL